MLGCDDEFENTNNSYVLFDLVVPDLFQMIQCALNIVEHNCAAHLEQQSPLFLLLDNSDYAHKCPFQVPNFGGLLAFY